MAVIMLLWPGRSHHVGNEVEPCGNEVEALNLLSTAVSTCLSVYMWINVSYSWRY